jgi:redox-sensitive bicupin YhaK (pirin superfamily)
LSIVLRLPWHTEPPPTSIQIKDAGDATDSLDGTVRRPVMGPLARAETFLQLECTDIDFMREADVSIPIERGRRGIAYVLRGSGTIEKKPVEMGHGALFENVSKVALYGSPGLRVFLATVPVVGNREED